MTFKECFAGYDVSIDDGGMEGHHFSVLFSPPGRDTQLSNRSILGQYINYTHSELYIYGAFEQSQESRSSHGLTKDRGQIIEGIGVGLGHTAAHELVHQFNGKTPLAGVNHSRSDGDIMWGNDQDKELMYPPAELFYGKQGWRAKDLELINKSVARVQQ